MRSSKNKFLRLSFSFVLSYSSVMLACSPLPSEVSLKWNSSAQYVGLANWTGRDSFGTTTLPGTDSVVILGGFLPERTDEAWISGDLRHWYRLVLSGQAPTPRNGHCMVQNSGSLFVIGGFDGRKMLSDVYVSRDARSWTRVSDGPFAPRAFFGCVSLKGRIFIYGGNVDQGVATNDVWSSIDGINWQRVTPEASWSPRGMFAGFSFLNKLWLIGGGTYDSRYVVNVKDNFSEIWSSVDGKIWEADTLPDFISPRRFVGGVSTRTHAYLIAGFELDRRLFFSQHLGVLWDGQLVPELFRTDPLRAGREFGNLAEIWVSQDLRQWQKVETPSEFFPRHAPGVTVVGNEVVVLGGFGQSLYNDVWKIVAVTR